MWQIRGLLLLALATASPARADAPITTVIFGAPAAEPRVAATPSEAPPGASATPARSDAARPSRPDPSVPSPTPPSAPASAPSSTPASPPGATTSATTASRPAAIPPGATASTPTSGPTASTNATRRAPDSPGPSCPRPVTLLRRIRGRTERVRMPLLDCEGRPREEARLAVSVLARSRSVEEPPSEDALRAWRQSGRPELVADGVRLIHPGLLERLQRVGEAFDPHPIEIVSGYRPDARPRSRHHHARALDVVVVGASREALRDLALTFERTGVGWYPNSTFVHIDVREESAYWVDLSRPGERPRYVRGARPPEPPASEPSGEVPRIDEALEAVRRGVRVALPGESAEDDGAPPSDDELARIRRETEAALRGIVVPSL